MPKLSDSIRSAAHEIWGSDKDYRPLLAAIADCRFVLLGEASHGTHEFYAARAQLTRLLIEQKGFNAVIVEADWPDAYRVNRYVRDLSPDQDAVDALADFRRFPQWMWRNADVLDFIGWLRQHNDDQAEDHHKTGFYGMDLYSLYASISSVLQYLDKTDRAAAKRARYRYECFEHFHENPQAYGYAADFDLNASCEKSAVQQLVDLRKHAGDYASRDGRIAADAYFFAEQNARLVKNAEEYYRTMFGGQVSSWNLRDRHMVETLDALVAHLDAMGQGKKTKVVVWAHNSHLGDARATEMAERGELNVGQLMRENHGTDVFSVGFTTHTGTVTAATNWDGPAELKRVTPSLDESWEHLLHDSGSPAFYLSWRDDTRLAELLNEPRLQRAIGVIYRPKTERASHYFDAKLAAQFDAVIHFDVTRAVEPLERRAVWKDQEVPEAYPTGL